MSKFRWIWLSIGLIYFQNARAQDLSLGRVAQYLFNGDVKDAVGTNHGTNFGAIPTTDRFGNPNSAYEFDGMNDYIEIPSIPAVDFGADQDFTVSLWAWISPIQKDMTGNNNDIFGKWDALITSGYPYALRYWNEAAAINNQHKIFTHRYDTDACNGLSGMTASCMITTGTWHHLVFKKEGSQLSYYQDIDLMGTVTDNSTLTCDTKNGLPILVGTRDKTRRMFTGKIDDISLYNRALSKVEINSLFDIEKIQVNTPRIVDFSFEQQVSPALLDSTLHTITAEMKCDADLSNLVANFILSDNTSAFVDLKEQFTGKTANDYTLPVIYTLRNTSDLCLQQDWTVLVKTTITETLGVTDFKAFGIPEQIDSTVIDPSGFTITLTVDCQTDKSALVAEFIVSPGAKAYVNGIEQASNISINDYSVPVVYTLINENECSARDWKVIVGNQTVVSKAMLENDPDSYFVPNVITPNGDRFNETFAIGKNLSGSKLTIYNRWGKKVYQNATYRDEFDGRNLVPGTYYYSLQNPCIESPVKGTLHIFR